MPTVPGGQEKQLEVLRSALDYIATHTPDRESLIPWPSADKQAQAGEVANQLAPAGLVQRLPNQRIALTDDARQWLVARDDDFLITVMHNNVRFVGELLAELGTEGLTASEARRIANDKYHLGWGSLDQVHRRTAWLQATEMIKQTFDHRLVPTMRGMTLLDRLNVATSDEIAYVTADVDASAIALPTAPPQIQALLDDLDEQALCTRRAPSSMYVPKGRGSAIDTLTPLRMQVEVMAPDGTKSSFLTFCGTQFNSAEASARAGLDTLRNCGLIQQTGFETYAATPAAKSWLESDEPLDLLRILHAHLRCVAELLTLMQEPRSVGELGSLATETYGVRLHDPALRVRLQLLRECDLVRLMTASTYQATARGLAFAELMPLEHARPAELGTNSLDSASAGRPASTALVEELQDAAQDTRQPARFEAAVAAVLRSLGLHAVDLGGPGDTDVLVTVRTTPTSYTKVIVDAKATSHPSVLEGAIDFTTLEEHRRRHNADRVALVGIGFDAGRTLKRARDQGVALITVDQLAEVVDRHRTSPLTPVELLALFESDGQDDLWTVADQRSALITAVIRAVAEEAEYVEEAGEGFTSKDIHKTLRRALSPTPSQEDVTAVLDLLASPLVAGIVPDGKGAYRPGAPAEAIGARLQAIANASYAAEAE